MEERIEWMNESKAETDWFSNSLVFGGNSFVAGLEKTAAYHKLSF